MFDLFILAPSHLHWVELDSNFIFVCDFSARPFCGYCLFKHTHKNKIIFQMVLGTLPPNNSSTFQNQTSFIHLYSLTRFLFLQLTRDMAFQARSVPWGSSESSLCSNLHTGWMATRAGTCHRPPCTPLGWRCTGEVWLGAVPRLGPPRKHSTLRVGHPNHFDWAGAPCSASSASTQKRTGRKGSFVRDVGKNRSWHLKVQLSFTQSSTIWTFLWYSLWWWFP